MNCKKKIMFFLMVTFKEWKFLSKHEGHFNETKKLPDLGQFVFKSNKLVITIPSHKLLTQQSHQSRHQKIQNSSFLLQRCSIYYL